MLDYAEIKRTIRMEQVLQAYSIPVREHLAVCPFHKDSHPSLRVYPDGYYCFSCGAGGDVITFVARMDGVSNRAAAETICRMFGLPVDRRPTRAEVAMRLKAGRERAELAAVKEKALRQSRILCLARMADGGRWSEWDYWIDYLDDDPIGFYKNGGEEVVRRGLWHYRRQLELAGDAVGLLDINN